MTALSEPLPPLPPTGRRYRQLRRIRLNDVTPSARMRVDAIARFLQDIATDDVTDGQLDEPAWVVRRTLVQVDQFPRYQESVTVTTFCWSMGSRFAERRTAIVGADGGRLDTLTLWVRLDPVTGRPTPLSDAFRALYAEAVDGRKTRHQLRHEGPPDRPAARTWGLRHSDFDLHGHVNNSVYWTVVEDRLADLDDGTTPRCFEMEFRLPIDPGTLVSVVQHDQPEELGLWLTNGERTFASARIAIPSR